jgi:hypothetical protein
MHILTEQNKLYSMDNIQIDNSSNDAAEDIRYCVLDYSDIHNVDYYCVPLLFLENFSSPAADLQIGEYRVQIPLDWYILVGEKYFGDLEVIPVMNCLHKDFNAFCFNPIDGYRPEFGLLDVVNVYPDIKWYMPKLKFGHLLAIPLENKPKPNCCFIVRDIHKLPDTIDISKLI